MIGRTKGLFAAVGLCALLAMGGCSVFSIKTVAMDGGKPMPKAKAALIGTVGSSGIGEPESKVLQDAGVYWEVEVVKIDGKDAPQNVNVAVRPGQHSITVHCFTAITSPTNTIHRANYQMTEEVNLKAGRTYNPAGGYINANACRRGVTSYKSG